MPKASCAMVQIPNTARMMLLPARLGRYPYVVNSTGHWGVTSVQNFREPMVQVLARVDAASEGYL